MIKKKIEEKNENTTFSFGKGVGRGELGNKKTNEDVCGHVQNPHDKHHQNISQTCTSEKIRNKTLAKFKNIDLFVLL